MPLPPIELHDRKAQDKKHSGGPLVHHYVGVLQGGKRTSGFLSSPKGLGTEGAIVHELQPAPRCDSLVSARKKKINVGLNAEENSHTETTNPAQLTRQLPNDQCQRQGSSGWERMARWGWEKPFKHGPGSTETSHKHAPFTAAKLVRVTWSPHHRCRPCHSRS